MSRPSVPGVTGLSGHPSGTVGLWPLVRAPKLFVALTGSLIVLAWVALAVWKWSPYGRFLGHEEVGQVAPLSSGYMRLLVFFVAAWTLMTVAMMLPTSLPLIAFFDALVRKRPQRVSLVGLLVSGYLSVWIAFAAGVHLGDQAIHASVERIGWLEANAWGITAAMLFGAGLYQFSDLKYRCLDKCRSPAGFILGRWHGRSERLDALRLGIAHGLFCLGCCWSLMLLMFAVGVGNIGWMLALASVMAIEKNAAWGRKLTAPIGVALLLSAAALAVAEGATA